MSVLVSISNSVIGSEAVNSVSARELHAKLEIKSKFADWIKNRISQYGFILGEDYEVLQATEISVLKNENGELPGLQKNTSSGFSATEYIISLDMAKELAMVENNDKGREVRKYFIAAEKDLAARVTTEIAAEFLMEQYKERAELRKVAERAIAGNVMEKARLGIRVHNGLTSAEWLEIREAIGLVAEYGDGSDVESDMIYNAVHAHMIRYFGASNGGVLPFRGALMYLREIRARYAAGYRPTYVAGRLVYDLTMC